MSYTIQDLERDLVQGREIEFIYNNCQYSITRIKKGWSLSKFYDESSIQNFSTHVDLLSHARIEEQLLVTILNKIEISAIF